ncbi:MAG: IS66 family insertion sequence element accessory protein TnpB [Planctomycetota bacterium]|jgi:transposase
MLPVVNQLRFFLYRHPTDMRKSFDGLCGVINQALAMDPLSGDVYVFVNRRRDRIKLLVWDRGGFWIFYKRLEQGTFQLPPDSGKRDTIVLPYAELMMLIEGIDFSSVKHRKRYDIFRQNNGIAL